MAEAPVSKDVIINRLKKIEGQVRGLEKKVEGGRECEAILIQLAAVRSAIESVGALILKNYMTLCFRADETDDRNNIDSLARAISVWGGVRIND